VSVVAPPRPPDLDAPADPEALEALIEEARRRARRRRQAYGLAALLLATLGAGSFFAFRGGGGAELAPVTHGAAPAQPPPHVRPVPRANGVLTFTSGETTSVVDVGDGRLRSLALCQAVIGSAPGCTIHDFAWSPDGRTLAFLVGRIGEPAAGLLGDFSLYAADADGTHVVRLAHCGKCGADYRYMSWSPDSRQIAMQASDGLHVIAVTSSAPPAIAVGPIRGADRLIGPGGNSPAWSPDGSKIAFASLESGWFSLVTVRPDGTSRTTLARVANVENIAWSPNGRRLAFDGSAGIYSIRADGSDMRVLVHASSASQPGAPAWSPDGRHIVFLSDTAHLFAVSVWIMNSDGRSRRLLYRAGCCVGPYSRPIWSPDGREIAVNAASPRGSGVVVMDADGDVLRTVHSPADAPADLTWQSVAPRH